MAPASRSTSKPGLPSRIRSVRRVRCRAPLFPSAEGCRAVLLCVVLLFAAGCSRRPAPEPTEPYPESYTGGAVLRLAGGGLAALEPGAVSVPPGLPAGVAPSVAALAAVDGRTAVLALNRTGLAMLRIDPERRRFRIEPLGTGEEFAGRSVGGLFVREGTAFCLLYRDPLFETEAPRDPPSVLLEADPGNLETRLRPFDLGLGPEAARLFAVFPRPDGSWTLQLRTPVKDGFESSFRRYDPGSGSVRALSRREFEEDLAPRLLSSAPDALRRAARVLAPEGYPALVSVSLADGSRGAYVFGDGNPEDTVELRGAVTDRGAALVAWNAVAATAREEGESAFLLPLPMPGAVYRDAVPLEGAVLAVWEVGVFPNIEESGVVLLPAP